MYGGRRFDIKRPMKYRNYTKEHAEIIEDFISEIKANLHIEE